MPIYRIFRHTNETHLDSIFIDALSEEAALLIAKQDNVDDYYVYLGGTHDTRPEACGFSVAKGYEIPKGIPTQVAIVSVEKGTKEVTGDVGSDKK